MTFPPRFIKEGLRGGEKVRGEKRAGKPQGQTGMPKMISTTSWQMSSPQKRRSNSKKKSNYEKKGSRRKGRAHRRKRRTSESS